jgi:histone-lysine N-methyltransferase ASH1L
MAPRTSRSIASTAPDTQVHEPTDDNMSLDVPEQLLTPENSRSETSSNNENALTDEKPAGRRRSTRVARASLPADEPLNDTPENEEPASSSSEAYVDSLAKAKRSHSSLRHSIAVMESSLWSGTPIDDDTVADDTMAPDTPVSKSSQDLQSEDVNMNLQQRTLRKRVGKALAEDEGTATAELVPSRPSLRKSLRRSARFSLMDKASDLVDRASSILGKRTRGLGDKDLGRRASLRPRNIAPSTDETAKEPVSKKRRVSESDLSKLQDEDSPEPGEPSVPASPRPRRKVWLTHGLYTGQEPSDSPPKQRRSRNSKKTGTGPMHRTILPMPMFKGARLLKTGRDFQLPFDIFSPLPPGQPKPDEWRKTNKSELHIVYLCPIMK